MYAAMSTGTTRTSSRLPGHRKFMTPDPSRSSGHPPRPGSAAPQLSHRRESHDRAHQVLVGRELEGVDAGAPECGTQRLLTLPDHGGEARPELPVVRVDPQVLAGLG